MYEIEFLDTALNTRKEQIFTNQQAIKAHFQSVFDNFDETMSRLKQQYNI